MRRRSVSGLALLRARQGASVLDRGVLLTSGAGPIPQGRMLSSMAAVPEDDRKIFVGNLAWRVSSEDLHSHFQQWGQIEDARVIMDRENPFRSRGFGFVTFSRAEDAQSAISMNHDRVERSQHPCQPRQPTASPPIGVIAACCKHGWLWMRSR